MSSKDLSPTLSRLQRSAIRALTAWQKSARESGSVMAVAIPRIIQAARRLDPATGRVRVQARQDRFFSRHDVEEVVGVTGKSITPSQVFESLLRGGIVPGWVANNRAERTKAIHRINSHLMVIRAGQRTYNKADPRRRPNEALIAAARAIFAQA